MIKYAEERGICISYAATIHPSYSEEFFEEVAERIISEDKSNVVVLFIHVSTTK